MSEKQYTMKDADKVEDILYSLRGQVGAVSYLMDPERTCRESSGRQHIETWLSDIGAKLDEALELL